MMTLSLKSSRMRMTRKPPPFANSALRRLRLSMFDPTFFLRIFPLLAWFEHHYFVVCAPCSTIHLLACCRILKRQQMRENDHGVYSEIAHEKELMLLTTSTEKIIVHFFHKDFRRCAIMDKHLNVCVCGKKDCQNKGEGWRKMRWDDKREV